MTALAVLVYLAAIVAANLAVVAFGPGATIPIAFLFVGLDLTLRDTLHLAWEGRQLVPRMGALIAVGGLLSYLVNVNAGQIAVASTLAFTLAAIADALVYAALGDRRQWVRMNGSNIAGAAVDSIVFPTVAFGALFPLVIVGQFVAKVAGGLLWSVILAVPVRPRPA